MSVLNESSVATRMLCEEDSDHQTARGHHAAEDDAEHPSQKEEEPDTHEASEKEGGSGNFRPADNEDH